MYLIVIFILLFPTILFPATQITITEPGTYKLGGNITYNTTSAGDSIILINTNNVVLDLNSYILTQGNPASPMLAGVAVASNLSNIKIKNGTINAINGSGVLIQSGDQGVTIDNITTNTCATGFNVQSAMLTTFNNISSLYSTGNAILINTSSFVQLNNIFAYSPGSDAILFQQAQSCSLSQALISKSSANGISITTKSDLINLDNIVTISCQTNGINLSQSTNCNITNCAILNCAIVGNTVFNISQSNFLNIIGCKLLQNGGNNALTAINISGCNQSLFQDIVITSSITTNSLNGIFADQTNQVIYRNCNLVSSFSNGMVGFFLNSSNTTSSILEDCSVANCVSFPGGLAAFLLGSTGSPSNIVLKNCNILNNLSGPNLSGYDVTASPASFYYFEDCNIKNNTCTSDTSPIYNFNNLTNLVISGGSIVNNILGPTNGGGQGFKGIELINSSLGCIDNLIISNCSSPNSSAVGADFGATTSCHMTDCQITNNVAQGTSLGIQFRANAVLCNLIRCACNNQYSTGSSAVGFNLVSTTSCAGQDCIAIRNNANGGTAGFSLSGSFDTFVRNSAIGHPNNNFLGFNANNFTVPAGATDTNSSCTPWTNFGING